MNNLKIYITSICWLMLIHGAIAKENVILDKKENIVASFNFDKNSQLLLVIKNKSTENVLLTTNIDHLISSGLKGFPQSAAIQFRSKDKKTINLKDQAENGWLYPNLYNSKLDFQIIDGKFKDGADDAFRSLLVPSKSFTSRPIDYSVGMKLVSSELHSANEFRIMWKIVIKDAGTIINKEIVSDWFHYQSKHSKITDSP